MINPNAEVVHIKSAGGNIDIQSETDQPLNIIMTGESHDGNIRITALSSVNLILDSLVLNSKEREAINIQSKKESVILCRNKCVIADGATRNEEATSQCSSCIYAQGEMVLKGEGPLLVTGNFKHAIQSNKKLTTTANINIASAAGSGMKTKKQMIVEDGSITIESIGNNGIDVEKGNFIFNKGNIDIRLTTTGTKGVKADSLYIQNGGNLSLNLFADKCKGIKTKRGIHINNGEVQGKASGEVVVTDGDPSYCTFLKCDSNIVISNAHLDLWHYGKGGKCISTDGDFKFQDAVLNATLTGDGGWYINGNGEDDYFTPRAIEANDSLTIISGKIDIHCTGTGGKGLVCDHDLTIGELYGDNDKLYINITTEGTSIVNDTIADFRKGCPKAMKSADQLDILSGNIDIKTCGMGGEGLESKNELYIVGGNITLDTFDDSVNGEKSIDVYGGTIYCCSQDNDGFDSNGCINILGGTIFSVSLHPQNESFDTEGNTLNIWAGTLLGIGGGTICPQRSHIPFYSYPKWTSDIIRVPMPNVSLLKGSLIQIMQDNECVMSGKVPADMDAAIITVASALLNTKKEYDVVEDNGISSTLKFSFKPKYYY